MDSSLNKFSKLNDSIIKVLEKPIIKYGLLIIIIGQIIAIKHLSMSYLEIFNNNYFKVIYAFFIAYYACFDPIYAIALTTLMIISIQEIHSRNASKSFNALVPLKNSNINNNNVMPINSNSIKKSMDNFIKSKNNTTSASTSTSTGNDYLNIFDNSKSSKSGKLLIDDKTSYDIINKQILQKEPSSDDNLKHEYEFCDQPAYKTITNNLDENDDTINKDIKNLQTISIQGLQGDIETIQGLPSGFNKKKTKMNLL